MKAGYFTHIPSIEDFQKYQEIGTKIVQIFSENRLNANDGLRVLEMTSAIAIQRLGEDFNEDPIKLVEHFAINIRSYLNQL